MNGLVYLTVLPVISAFMGLLPAFIAKSKGHSFGKWWLYCWLVFGVAVIHVMFISDECMEERQKGIYESDDSQARIYSLLAGVCFLFIGLFYTTRTIWYGWTMELQTMCLCAARLAFAVMLLVGKKNKGALAVSVFYLLVQLPNIRYGIYGALNSYGALLLTFLIAGSVLPALRKNASKMVKRAWFLPAIYFLLDFLLRQLPFLYLGFDYFSLMWVHHLMNLLECIAFLLMGLWLQAFPAEALGQKREPAAVIYTESYLRNQAAVLEENHSETEEALRSYRTLVDSGIMTREEFEEKKRELLQK